MINSILLILCVRHECISSNNAKKVQLRLKLLEGKMKMSQRVEGRCAQCVQQLFYISVFTKYIMSFFIYFFYV